MVNTEHPYFITAGFLFIVAGFIIQFFSVPEPESIAGLRRKIKALKMKQDAELEALRNGSMKHGRGE